MTLESNLAPCINDVITILNVIPLVTSKKIRIELKSENERYEQMLHREMLNTF